MTTESRDEIRCDPPACVRYIGHTGPCRSAWRSDDVERCGRWMPYAQAPCGRRAGHGLKCRSTFAVTYDLDRSWRRYHGRKAA